MKKHHIIAIAAVGMLALGANSCDEKGLGDAPVGNAYEGERDIIVMPDTFPNLAVVCDGPTRVYVTTREAAPVVVADHPACRGEDFLTEGDTVPYEGEGEE